MKLILIVIYTTQLYEMQAFYESLGLRFTKEKHGNGPEHFSCVVSPDVILELYPASKNSIRFEFKIGQILEVSEQLVKNGWSNHIGFRNGLGSLYLLDPDYNEVMLSPARAPVNFISIE